MQSIDHFRCSKKSQIMDKRDLHRDRPCETVYHLFLQIANREVNIGREVLAIWRSPFASNFNHSGKATPCRDGFNSLLEYCPLFHRYRLKFFTELFSFRRKGSLPQVNSLFSEAKNQNAHKWARSKELGSKGHRTPLNASKAN